MPKKRKRIPDRMQYLIDHPEEMELLTDEEIQKGRLLASDGTFKGRPTTLVPRKFHELMVQEQIRRFNRKVAETLEPSLQVLHDIAQNKTQKGVPADARMKAAIYLIERTVGKVPEKTEMKVEVAKWEQDIEGLFFEDPDEVEAE